MPTIAAETPRRAAGRGPRIRQAASEWQKPTCVVDGRMLEFCIRELLNKSSLRRMAVLRPLKVVIENYPEGQSEDSKRQPSRRSRAGTRRIAFGRELYIEQDDSWKIRRRVFPPLAGHRSAVCVTPISSNAPKSSRMPPARSSTALHLRSRDQGGNAPDGRR